MEKILVGIKAKLVNSSGSGGGSGGGGALRISGNQTMKASTFRLMVLEWITVELSLDDETIKFLWVTEKLPSVAKPINLRKDKFH